MSSDHMERTLKTALISRPLGEPRPISTAPCQYLQREDAGSMGNEISESGWTMYLDQSVDSWRDKYATSQFDIEHEQYAQDVERCPTYDYQAFTITGNEDSSLASDASSGPQKLPLPLPVQDIEFQLDRRATSSLVSVRKRGADDKHEDLECMASCSSADVNITRDKLRKVSKNEDDLELALLLQDTASSPMHRPELLEANTRLEVLQSLLHMERRLVEKSYGGSIEYTNSTQRIIQEPHFLVSSKFVEEKSSGRTWFQSCSLQVNDKRNEISCNSSAGSYVVAQGARIIP